MSERERERLRLRLNFISELETVENYTRAINTEVTSRCRTESGDS